MSQFSSHHLLPGSSQGADSLRRGRGEVIIGLINVNSTAEMTQTMVEVAQQCARPGYRIVGVTPPSAPPTVETHCQAAKSVTAMVDAISPISDHFDGLIVAGFGDPGKSALAEIFAGPIVDITEAALMSAMLISHRWVVVTTVSSTVPMISDLVTSKGLSSRCEAIVATGIGVAELEGRGSSLADDIAQGALPHLSPETTAVCLGCGGMAGLAEEVHYRLTDLVAARDPELANTKSIYVVDGVTAAVGMICALISGLGNQLRQSTDSS